MPPQKSYGRYFEIIIELKKLLCLHLSEWKKSVIQVQMQTNIQENWST
jgi:hypothetical protein